MIKYFNISNLSLLFIAISFFLVGLYSKSNWQQSRHSGDGLGYYIYLPSVLIHKDLGDFKNTSQALKKYVPNLPDLSEDIYGFRPTPIGKLADKYPIGVAILQSPFFLVGHLYATQTQNYDPDGFSRPYQVMCFFSTMFYVILGLWLLQKTLHQYYGPTVSALTITFLGLGTNLLFFTSVFTAMSHGYQFFAVCMLIYFTNKLYQSPNILRCVLMGISLGLIAIIRTQDLILGLIPLLWGISSIQNVKTRIRFISDHLKIFIFSVLAFMLAISIQLIYYKYISGQWFYFSYIGESFNWNKPKIINGLFDARNGWFLYTPLMLPVIVSLVLRTKHREVWILPLCLIFGLHVYISYSWWCWYYIAGLGSRPMVDIYPVLAFALAGLITWLFSKPKFVGIPAIILLVFLGAQNLRFSYQQFHGYIFSETNNWAYYQSMFLKIKPQKDDIIAFNTHDIQPDLAKLKLVDTLYQSDFEALKENVDSIIVYSGKYSINMENQDINITMMNLKDFNLQKEDWLKVSLDAYVDMDGFWFFNLPKFVLEFKEHDSSENIWKQSNPIALINNETNSIWFTGQPKKWERVTYFTKIPFSPDESSTIRILGFNPSKIKWNMDNLLIEVYKLN